MTDIRNGLAVILEAIDGIDRTLPPDEQQRQLEIQQKVFVRTWAQAAECGLLPGWVPIPDDGDPLLPTWEAIARKMESDYSSLPHVDDIADGQLPLIGTSREVNLSPPERIGAWIAHARAVVQCAIDSLAPGESSKPRIVLNNYSLTIDGKLIPIGNNRAWETFENLWKNQNDYIQLDKDCVRDLRNRLRKASVGWLADAIRPGSGRMYCLALTH